MKKLLSAICIILMLVTLTACAGDTPSPHKEAELDPNPNIVMRTVYPVYDKSCQTVTILIENQGEETLEFGAYWKLERLSGKRWVSLNTAQNTVFNDILYMIESGGKRYDDCYLQTYLTEVKEGQYRIVKEINGAYYTAEFEIGESPITSESPYGFVPPENIPQGYTAEDAAADGAVVLRNGQTVNGERISAFFNEWHHFQYKGQLRVAVETETGLLLTDLFYEDNRITHRTADRRTDATATDVTTAYYSFFHIHDGAMYLSNHSDFGEYAENVRLFHGAEVPQNITDAIVPYVDISGPAHLLDVWSPDGETHVFVNENGHTYVSTSGWGTAFGGKFIGKKILEFVWIDNSTFMVMAENDTEGAQYFYEFIRATAVNDVETISYTVSAYRYEIQNGEIIIPE